MGRIETASYGLQRKGSRVAPGKGSGWRGGALGTRGSLASARRGSRERPPAARARWDMADCQTAKKQEDRTKRMMLLGTPEKVSEQERQSRRAGWEQSCLEAWLSDADVKGHFAMLCWDQPAASCVFPDANLKQPSSLYQGRQYLETSFCAYLSLSFVCTAGMILGRSEHHREVRK